jgi:hypothetical protein
VEATFEEEKGKQGKGAANYSLPVCCEWRPGKNARGVR